MHGRIARNTFQSETTQLAANLNAFFSRTCGLAVGKYFVGNFVLNALHRSEALHQAAHGRILWGVNRTHAILLHKTRLTESSLIVTWLSASHGRLKTVAKGALRPKSRLAGVLDSLQMCEIRFSPARSGELHGLKEAILVDPFVNLRTDYHRLSLAAYAVELIERATEPEFPVPELMDLLQRLLRFLDANAASARALRHFESELVRLLGVAQPGVSAEESLGQLLRRLPANRGELLSRLSVL